MKRILLTLSMLLACTWAAIAQDSPQTARKVVIGVTNASVTGTTRFRLAKLTGAPSKAVIVSTTDTDGAIGIVTANAGTSLTATIQTEGLVNCDFDDATTAGNYVQISSSTAGKCHDAGSSYPASGQVLGRVLSTNGSSGNYQMVLGPTAKGFGAGFTGSGTANKVTKFTGATALGNSGITDDGTTVSTTEAVDLSGASSFKPPASAGAAPTVENTIAFDTTSHTLEYGENGTNRTVANLNGAQTLTNKIIDGANNTLTARIANDVSGLGTGVAGALGTNTGAAGAFVVNGGAMGTPSSGTVTNLTGTASININGTVGATTPTTGAFTTGTFSGSIKAGTIGGSVPTSTGIYGENTVSAVNGNTTVYLTTNGTTFALDGYNHATSSGLGLKIASNGGSVQFAGSGVIVGNPTGGDKLAGSINLSGDIYKNGTAYTNPDYVFEKFATGRIERFAGNEGALAYTGPMPLDELKAYVTTNYHLPGFGPNANHGLFSGSDTLLRYVEELHIRLFRMDDRIKELERGAQQSEALKTRSPN